jgi:hypothetical protein
MDICSVAKSDGCEKKQKKARRSGENHRYTRMNTDAFSCCCCGETKYDDCEKKPVEINRQKRASKASSKKGPQVPQNHKKKIRVHPCVSVVTKKRPAGPKNHKKKIRVHPCVSVVTKKRPAGPKNHKKKSVFIRVYPWLLKKGPQAPQ